MAQKRKSPGDESHELNLSLLKRLLRAAEHLSMGGFERPSNESIRAYVAGHPTLQQQREVQSALAHSANFRSELLALAEEHGSPHEKQTLAREDDVDKLVITRVHPPGRPDIIALHLDGRVPDNFAPLLEEAFDNLFDDGYSRIVLDLGDVSYISSKAWSAVFHAGRRAQRTGGGVKLAAMQFTVWSIFKLLELDRFVECYPSVAQAVARIQHDEKNTENELLSPFDDDQ